MHENKYIDRLIQYVSVYKTFKILKYEYNYCTVN